jgi:hypothetical protein
MASVKFVLSLTPNQKRAVAVRLWVWLCAAVATDSNATQRTALAPRGDNASCHALLLLL